MCSRVSSVGNLDGPEKGKIFELDRAQRCKKRSVALRSGWRAARD